MNRVVLLRRLLVATILGATANQAAADPPLFLRDYRFIPSHSNVHVSGGFAGLDMDFSIMGKFGLVTGYNYGVSPTAHLPILEPFAEFVDVHAVMYNPLSMSPGFIPGWDLDQTLNLSNLRGTFQDPRVLHFTGEDGRGMPIKVDAVLRGPLIHITGENRPTCCDFFNYKIDAFAHLAPYADFNLDGSINRTDLQTLLAHIGTPAGASFDDGDADGDGDVDGSDFLVWQRTYGLATSMTEFADAGTATSAIPEPSSVLLVLGGIMLLIGFRSRVISR